MPRAKSVAAVTAVAGEMTLAIPAPKVEKLSVRIVGTAPLMTHKFSEKMRKQMQDKQTAKDRTTAGKREPKDYEAEFNAARYIDESGEWDGIPASAIRAAMIAACRTIDSISMTEAKGMFFVNADGRDVTDGTPLVRIHGKAKHDTRPVRLESGVADMRNRPRYDDWHCDVAIEFDADRMSKTDVYHLLHRAGRFVGLCELRPQGKKSFGGDFGVFSVEERAVHTTKFKPSTAKAA